MRERGPKEFAYHPGPAARAPTLEDPTPVQLCGTGVILYEDPDTRCLTLVPTRCNRWDCPTCGTFRRIALASKAAAGRPERFITLTLRPDRGRSLETVLNSLRRSWTRLAARIKRIHGPFEWFCALELTKQDTPHLHILMRGSYISHRWLSQAWCKLTGSYIVDIRKVKTYAGASNELTKYVTKTAAALQKEAPGRPIVTMSRGWLPADYGEDPDRQPPDRHAAHFALSFTDAALLIDALGGTLIPVADRPRCWFADFPAPLGRESLHAIPLELDDKLKAMAYYLVWRCTPELRYDCDFMQEVAVVWGVRTAAWAEATRSYTFHKPWEDIYRASELRALAHRTPALAAA